MVQPGAEDPRPAQLAPVLVRHDVVRIVGAGAVVAEVAERPARGEAAGQRPIAAVGLTRGTVEHVGEVAARERPSLPGERIADRRLLRDDEVVGGELGQVHLHRVVAERVVERGADDLGAGRHFRMVGRVDLDLVGLPAGVGHPEPGLDAGALVARDDPAVERDLRRTAIGPAHQRVERHLAAADAIGEPARIRHLVHRVHVHRAHVAALTLVAERIDDEVVAVAVLLRHRLRGVHHPVVVHPDRIVGIERRACRGQRARRHQGRDRRRQGQPRRH